MGAKLKRFLKDLDKIQRQGVVYETRYSSGFVYTLSVNLDGKFVVRKWRYWNGACHGRKPVEEWAYYKSDDAVAKFEEIKGEPWAKWDSYEKLSYVD